MCDYCVTDRDGYVNSFKDETKKYETRIKAFITSNFGTPVIRTDLYHISTEFKINFCPMCGRKLVKDADNHQ